MLDLYWAALLACPNELHAIPSFRKKFKALVCLLFFLLWSVPVLLPLSLTQKLKTLLHHLQALIPLLQLQRHKFMAGRHHLNEDLLNRGDSRATRSTVGPAYCRLLRFLHHHVSFQRVWISLPHPPTTLLLLFFGFLKSINLQSVALRIDSVAHLLPFVKPSQTTLGEEIKVYY